MTHPFPPLSEQFCGNCRYFRNGACHHSPPWTDNIFPLVDPTDWCGKWVPLEERQ